MNVALVYPPFSAAVSPHLALPALTAVLRREGHTVEQVDANLQLQRWLLAPAALEARREVLAEERRALPTGPESRSRRRSIDAWLDVLPVLAGRIEDSLAALQDAATWRLDPVGGAAGHLPHAGLVRVARTLLLDDLPLDRWTTLSAPDLVATAERGGHPLLSRFVEDRFVPWLRRCAPDLVGFTIPFRQQLLPALVMARAVHRVRPEAAVAIGGHLVTRQLGDLQRMAALFDIVDLAVVHDGEEAITGLCRRLERGEDLADTPNLLRRDGAGRVTLSGTGSTVRLDDLPAPDFDGLDLDGYQNGNVIFPLETSRGCYWNRCTYCSYHRGEDGSWRPFPPEVMARHVESLGRRGAQAMMVVDEALPPPRAEKLAGIIERCASGPAWYFMGRLEKGFTAARCARLAAAGLYGIFFGLESGCPEVLHRMDKGIELEVARQVLDHVAGAGLAAHISLIGGFPGESRAQAEETRDLAAELVRGVPGFTANAHTFHLQRDSEVFMHPDRFGIAGGLGEDGRTLAIHFEAEPLPGAAGPGPAELAGVINSGLRPLVHPGVVTEEEGVNYFITHGRDEFLRRWSLGLDRGKEGRSDDQGPLRATGMVLAGRGGSTLCHLGSGSLIGTPAVAGRILALFDEAPSLTPGAVWQRLGRPAQLPRDAVGKILGRLCELGALEPA
jgi:hypothetical protein